MKRHGYRWPLPGLALVVASLAALHAAAAQESVPIVAVVPELDRLQKWNEMHGDTADPFWADDDLLYHFTCDGRGFGTQQRNLCFNRLVGQDLANLRGTLVNPMDEYGKGGQTEKDRATWKVCGQECIDGVFYAFVVRNTYGDKSKDPLMRQTSFNASLIKSTDRGRTWTRTARENYDTPMWPGPRFGAPCFIHYGKDGGRIARDGADEYVYALSNNGFWNGGDDFILARVRREDLPRLRAADWTYYAAGAWTSDLAAAKPVLSRPAKLGWTAPAFIPALNRYLLVSWYVSPTLKKWFEPERVTYDFLEAPHPWGPWTFVSSFDDGFLGQGQHMYGPNLSAKYQERRGEDVEVQLFTSGCPFEDRPAGLYKNWRIPLTVKTRPPARAERVNDDDPAIRYVGEWQALERPGRGYHRGDLHATDRVGGAVEFAFDGTGIEVISEKFSDLGKMEVFLDGRSRGMVALKQDDFPRLVQITVFREEGLSAGPHTIRLVNRSDGWLSLDAFAVIGGRPPPAPVPTPAQLRWHDLEFYGFLHFTVNTFTGKEWGFGDEPPSAFNPTDFDADQIAQAFKDGGMKGVILTAKHHDGFCLWPSKFTEHSVKNSPWKNGAGDVVKEMAEACRRHGLAFGLYLSPWDRNHPEWGRPGYLTYYRNQLRELLTDYGPVFEVWFDGASGPDGRGGDGWYGGAKDTRRIDPATYYRWPEIFQLVRELQPGAHIQGDIGPDGRWGGNERGEAGDPCWATVRSGALVFPALDFELDLHGHRDGDVWMPPEMPQSIRSSAWFWRPGEDGKVESPQELFEKYLTTVGRGANWLLGLTPDTRGRIPEADVQALRGFRRILDETFRENLAAPALPVNQEAGAARGICWRAGAQAAPSEWVLDMRRPVTFDLVSLREHLPLGQRVDAFALDAWQDGRWLECAQGTSIGNRRLIRVPAVTTDKVRLRISGASAPPALSDFGLFKTMP